MSGAGPVPSDGRPGTPLPRPVAIAAARAAIHRSRTAGGGTSGSAVAVHDTVAVHDALAATAAWQRGRRRGPQALRPVRGRHGEARGGAADIRRRADMSVPEAPSPPPATADADSRPAGAARAAGAHLRTAVLERLPLWVRLRCAVEPKTLAALAVVLLVALGFAAHRFLEGRPAAVPAPEIASAAVPGPSVDTVGAARDASGGPGTGHLVVDVAGEVRDPGVHRLPRGSRVADALEAAGGVRSGTGEDELGGLNLARRLVDGEQIVVGAAKTVAVQPAVDAASGGAGSGTATRISLSSATAEQLETLPGVGPVLARHIIDYRAAHGGFTSVDQLREVDGIGDARFADIEPKVGP